MTARAETPTADADAADADAADADAADEDDAPLADAAAGPQPGVLPSSEAAAVASAAPPVAGAAAGLLGVPRNATKIGCIAKPKGEVYVVGCQVVLSFEKPLKALKKHCPLHSILGGTFKLANQKETLSMVYTADEKSWVCVDGEIDKLSKVISALSVKSVWGKDMQGVQVLPKLSSTGHPLDTFWSPPKDSLEVCRAFMQAQEVLTIFNMELKDDILTPCGVTFLLHQAVKLDTATQFITLGRP